MIDKTERHWYIIQTYSGYENRVKANLQQRIATMGMDEKVFHVLVPIEERVTVKDGRASAPRKVFPSYVPGDMVLDDQSWYVVRHRLASPVSWAELPIPLTEREVSEIMSKIGKEQIKPKIEIDLKPGDVVRVKAGPFEGQVGPVAEVLEDKGKVKFSVVVFGRDTLVEADYTDLEKI